jgi:hypothetical protein
VLEKAKCMYTIRTLFSKYNCKSNRIRD